MTNYFHTLLTAYIEGIPDLTFYYVLSQIMAVAAFILGNLAYLQKISHKGDKSLKIMIGSSASLNGVHYLFLGRWDGCLLSFAAGLRHICAGLYPGKNLFWLFVIVGTGLGLWFWHDWRDILSILGNILGCIAVYKNSGYRMRAWLVAGTFCWLVYTVLTYSLVGIVAETFYITMNVLRVIASYRAEKSCQTCPAVAEA